MDRMVGNHVAIVAIPALFCLSLLPSIAKAQNRGTMQVSAVVVDSKSEFAALYAARAATQSWAAPSSTAKPARDDVTTVAQVSVVPQSTPTPRGQSRISGLVVTIDYSKN